jgi:hypothetical protein
LKSDVVPKQGIGAASGEFCLHMDTSDTGAVAALLHIISAAVTPVVMISACASLLLTINNKHTNIADRMRSFAVELRSGTCTPVRRKQLLTEIGVFHRRFLLTYVAHMALNIAIIVFILSVIIIIFTQRRLVVSSRPTLWLFLSGTALMFVAMCCELWEISLSTRSLSAEMSDIVASPENPSSIPNPPGV